MCGRYVSKDEGAIERHFNLTRGGGHDVFKTVYNAAPTMLLPVVRDHRERSRELVPASPVILHAQNHAGWLDPKDSDAVGLQMLLTPYPWEEMRAYPVSARVNSSRNEGPELVEPA